MTRDDCRIVVNDETLVLDASGAAFWPAQATLVFADLHFEKGSAYARSGQLLPPYDTRSTLRRIERLMGHYRPARVIALGDSFHDDRAELRLDKEECAALKALTAATDWVWVEGNHDPNPPAWLGGRISAELGIGGLRFRHLPFEQPCAGEVAGHIHPVARISRGGLSLRRRCFVSDGLRLLMPAFGAYAGGLDITDEAVTSLFAREFAVLIMGRERVYAVRGPAHVLARKNSVDAQPRNTASRTVKTP